MAEFARDLRMTGQLAHLARCHAQEDDRMFVFLMRHTLSTGWLDMRF
jgi:hypothetical protein